MRKLALIVAVALLPSLGACAQLQNLRNDLSVISDARVSPQAVVVSAKVFNTLEGLATRYLALPRCNGSVPVCRSPAITRQVIPAVRKGRAARDSLIAFQRAHPGALGSQGAFDALNAAIDTLKTIIAQNAGGLS
jgi:hypothetical protein